MRQQEQQAAGDEGMRVKILAPIGRRDVQGLNVGHRVDTGRPGLRLDGGHLAHDLSRTADADDALPRADRDLDMTFAYQQGVVGLLTLAEQDAAARVPDGVADEFQVGPVLLAKEQSRPLVPGGSWVGFLHVRYTSSPYQHARVRSQDNPIRV